MAEERGIILADTKFEFGARAGRHDRARRRGAHARTRAASGRPIEWAPGKQQPSYDKQIVRDWLQFESGWDRHSGEAPPPLSDEVIERTRSAYIDAYEQLTGRTFTA